MSSMDGSRLRNRLSAAALIVPALLASVACHANDGSEWDQARASLVASQPTGMAAAVDKWRLLSASDRFSFSEYAGFLLAYPGFPDEEKVRRYAEKSLGTGYVEPARLVAFFDKVPPLTNAGRAEYALALKAMGRPEATSVARQAWRGGAMSDADESAILSTWGSTFSADDQDARMDALLWASATAQAERQLAWVSPARKGVDAARLAALKGTSPGAAGFYPTATTMADPGYVFQQTRYLRKTGQGSAARSLLANRPLLAKKPLDRDKWVEELLVNAKGAATAGDPRSAVRIAQGIDDAFDPGEDIRNLSYGLRDDYTSLMWLGGTEALWDLGAPREAAPLFWRFGNAAKTPGTRSKGFYWAGLAATRAGDANEAKRYFELGAQYADQFYGLLSLERLGRPVPSFAVDSVAVPTPQERAAFQAAPLTLAVREVARGGDWKTTVRFFKEIADQQDSEGEHMLVAELARSTGRRDLGVILGMAAGSHGFLDFQHIGFPLIPVPAGYDSKWTMIHAISRQESQFAQNALSHAGARGLMQLMPGTAREQAGKMALAYSPAALTDDPNYNIQLGSSYFQRMLDYYGGSWPLAVAAYNAGAGNVNKWLRANGDPRNGGISWVEWIERIPLYETRNYVTKVLENAVVYEAMNPGRASYRGPNPLSHFLGKGSPG
jgi:soluble lytic murein transglycosylase